MATLGSRRCTRALTVLGIVLVALGVTLCKTASAEERPRIVVPNDSSVCADFDDLWRNSQYSPGAVFVSRGTWLRATAWATSLWSPGGSVSVAQSGLAAGVGNELELEQAGVQLAWSNPRPALSFRFGEYGGMVALSVNHDVAQVDDFAELDGATIGGVSVAVTNGFGSDAGVVELSGPISDVVIAGELLWVDDVCVRHCSAFAHFDDLAAGSTYPYGTTFMTNGVRVGGEAFHYPWGWTAGGHAAIDGKSRAGGSGHDVMANNIGLRFDFGAPVQGVRFRFGEYGGNVNLEINGDLAIVGDFWQLDGLQMGGATIRVINGNGSATGSVELFGRIDTILIGGQELWLDDVCGGPRLAR